MTRKIQLSPELKQIIEKQTKDWMTELKRKNPRWPSPPPNPLFSDFKRAYLSFKISRLEYKIETLKDKLAKLENHGK